MGDKMILAIDPGWNLVAWVAGDRVIQAAGKIPLDGSAENRLQCLSASLRSVINEYVVNSVIIERPTVYHNKNVNPESIVKLSLIAGTCAGCVYLPIYMPTAPTWKGSVPKKIHNNRVLAQLSEKERGIIGTNHNVIDSAGLWLWVRKTGTNY
jgi:hypothetical protein